MPIPRRFFFADMHCDLLAYLSHQPGRSAFDAGLSCSVPRILQGGVRYQVLPIFVETGPGSTKMGELQIRALLDLLASAQGDLFRANTSESIEHLLSSAEKRLAVFPSIENASAIWEEEEDWNVGCRRLESMLARLGRPIYVSLTWTRENRFGGGDATQIGLKSDGKSLLALLARHHIAVDLTHASRPLAREILEFIDCQGLPLPVCCSHSCFDAVHRHPRNLTDEVAREIISRRGIIGLCFLRHLVGATPASVLSHIQYAWSLNAAQNVGLGADFFAEQDLPLDIRHGHFWPELQDPTSYETLFAWLGRETAAREDLEGLAFRNFLDFARRIFSTAS